MRTLRTLFVSVGLAGLVLSPACKGKKSEATEGPATDPGIAVGEPHPADPAGNDTETGTTDRPAPSDMPACPSAVVGAETAVQLNKGAVVVTVTSKEEKAVGEIRRRAQQLDTAGASADGLGECPVVMESGVKLAFEELADGAKIVLTAADPQQLARVGATAIKRADGMKAGAGSAAVEGTASDDDEAGEDEEPAEEP